MGRIGTTELLLILALAILLFGGTRLAGLGKALGKSIKDFRQEMKPDGGSAEPPKDGQTEDQDAQ